MEEETREKLAELTLQINSCTAVLKGYCENFVEDSKEISDLIDFVYILNKLTNELYNIV